MQQTKFEGKTTGASGLGIPTRNRVSKQTDIKWEPKNEDHFHSFISRWRIHDLARRISIDPKINPESAEKINLAKKNNIEIDYPRIFKCKHFVISNNQGVDVRRDPDKQLPHYKGLISCGSVWECPLCSTKISEHRKNELITGCENWTNMGEKNSKVHVIFTIPHYSDQSIGYVREKFMDARRKLKQQKTLKRHPLKTFKKICDEYGIAGTVTAQDITHGMNGWHIHSHDLFFINQELNDEQLQNLKSDLIEAWIYAIQRADIDIRCTIVQIKENSIEVKRARTPADYICKFGSDEYEKHKDILQKSWQVGEELTKNHIKKGKKNSRTPWDLLREILANPNDKELYMRNARLWKEYVNEFKGKRLLFYSKNFKKLLGLIEEKTDQEAAEAEDKGTNLVGELTSRQWSIIRRNRIKPEILVMSVHNDWNSLCDYIDRLG